MYKIAKLTVVATLALIGVGGCTPPAPIDDTPIVSKDDSPPSMPEYYRLKFVKREANRVGFRAYIYLDGSFDFKGIVEPKGVEVKVIQRLNLKAMGLPQAEIGNLSQVMVVDFDGPKEPTRPQQVLAAVTLKSGQNQEVILKKGSDDWIYTNKTWDLAPEDFRKRKKIEIDYKSEKSRKENGIELYKP